MDWAKSLVTLSGLPRPLQVGVYGLVGVAAGLALVLVRIANAASYLSDEPAACINCHVMTDAYVSWQRGSHGRVAGCVDCHVPHDNVVAKYAFKAEDGLRHSYVFTLRQEPQVLELSRRAAPVVQANCIRCHAHQVSGIMGQDVGWALAHAENDPIGRQEPLRPERRCWDCHQNIHGKVRSLSGSPPELRPSLPAAGIRPRRSLLLPRTRASRGADVQPRRNDQSSIIDNP